MKSSSPQQLRILHGECHAEAERVLAWRLHQAAVLLEMRRDGLAGYLPDSSLVGPSLRELQADVDLLSPDSFNLRLLSPVELCLRSRALGGDSPHLDLTMAASMFRSGQVEEGRDLYVQALLKAENRAIRARCLTSLAAIYCVEGDLVAAASFSQAAMRENSGMRIVQSNFLEIEERVDETGE